MRGVTPATISHYLKVLQESGLIVCRREGQFVYSQAIPETAEAYAGALTKMFTTTKSKRRGRG